MKAYKNLIHKAMDLPKPLNGKLDTTKLVGRDVWNRPKLPLGTPPDNHSIAKMLGRKVVQDDGLVELDTEAESPNKWARI